MKYLNCYQSDQEYNSNYEIGSYESLTPSCSIMFPDDFSEEEMFKQAQFAINSSKEYVDENPNGNGFDLRVIIEDDFAEYKLWKDGKVLE